MPFLHFARVPPLSRMTPPNPVIAVLSLYLLNCLFRLKPRNWLPRRGRSDPRNHITSVFQKSPHPDSLPPYRAGRGRHVSLRVKRSLGSCWGIEARTEMSWVVRSPFDTSGRTTQVPLSCVGSSQGSEEERGEGWRSASCQTGLLAIRRWHHLFEHSAVICPGRGVEAVQKSTIKGGVYDFSKREWQSL